MIKNISVLIFPERSNRKTFHKPMLFTWAKMLLCCTKQEK